MSANKNVVHIQQIHDHRELGTIFVNKYIQLGPHWLHFRIKTNWRAFHREKKELNLDWCIKLIRGKMYSGRVVLLKIKLEKLGSDGAEIDGGKNTSNIYCIELRK